jgi:hypothetical protein
MWGALSDERTHLSFTIAAGPSQRSHSRVRASWGSQPYFTVSDSRLSISSPLTARRVTVEVFDPASAEQSSTLVPATSQHGHSWHRAPLGPMAIYLFSVKTSVFFSFVVPPLIKGGVGLSVL